jgi:SagB-type dehydrogenase family enzyme
LARLARHPDLLLHLRGRGLLAWNLESRVHVQTDPVVAMILGLFDRPREPREVAGRLPGFGPRAVLTVIRRLRAARFLVPEAEARRLVSRVRAWRENLASALYHAASRDQRYLVAPGALADYVVKSVAIARRPPLFKRYRVRVRRPLDVAPADDPPTLQAALAARRTVREFSRAPVAFADLARIIQGTWGRTGVLDGGLLGRLITKTSPSGGSLHPIEVYVLAWRVAGLAPGLYHYDVASNELRRLKRGDFRRQAVRCASGQSWVGRAGFVCVMTAVFARTLWKYQLENAYRILWLDAGHLAQTFCLLAASRGLGPFTTGALQESYIEGLLGLDGIREFPVYLCGAGRAITRRNGSGPGA